MPLLPCERSSMATAASPACPLFEVHPEPELYADMVGIGVIFPVGEEVVGGDGHEEIRINGEVVPDKPLEPTWVRKIRAALSSPRLVSTDGQESLAVGTVAHLMPHDRQEKTTDRRRGSSPRYADVHTHKDIVNPEMV